MSRLQVAIYILSAVSAWNLPFQLLRNVTVHIGVLSENEGTDVGGNALSGKPSAGPDVGL